ncbi:hypothetical protein DFR86_11815 [Acidianus sulfidivorans JP7]|uniref:Uncharacterized protein n=1 Tax=Acidianus sulfidivorans JP7 TaxID=619593 RepID=A0A2U9IJ96_9CREN|nr:hypothetical protein [Acidianus sulfidivorans]AWR98154.1 hypothetical protein DFR86_11815 [Acidianus sulfidivorans JP7]
MEKYYVRQTTSQGKPRLHFYSSLSNSNHVKVFSSNSSLEDMRILLRILDDRHRLTKSHIYTDDESLFKRMVIFSGSVQNVKRRYVYNIMAEVISKFEELSLQYWYSEFTTKYLKRKNMVDTYRVGAALRRLYVRI